MVILIYQLGLEHFDLLSCDLSKMCKNGTKLAIGIKLDWVVLLRQAGIVVEINAKANMRNDNIESKVKKHKSIIYCFKTHLFQPK